MICGQSHTIRFKLGPAPDDGGLSYVRGQTRCCHLVLTIILEPMFLLYELSPDAPSCERVNEASPRLPDGRVLHVTMGAPRCIRASRRSTAKYRDSLMIPEALASGTCLFLLYPSELGTIGQMVATVCQFSMERQEYSHPALP